MKYSYGGDLKTIADPIVHKMLEHQVAQGNPKDVRVFKKHRDNGRKKGGFDWADTSEGFQFWESVLRDDNYGIFFERYPELKVETSQDDLMEMLHRIVAKLDQLLDGNKPKETDKVCTVKGFKVGDRVRVKSWKEIKRLTTEGIARRRVFADRSYFARAEKQACGKRGVIIHITPRDRYIIVEGSNWEYQLPPHALEKI